MCIKGVKSISEEPGWAINPVFYFIVNFLNCGSVSAKIPKELLTKH